MSSNNIVLNCTYEQIKKKYISLLADKVPVKDMNLNDLRMEVKVNDEYVPVEEFRIIIPMLE